MSPGFPSASPGSRSGFCFGRAFSCPPVPDWCSSCASTSRPAGPLYGYDGTVGPDGAMVRVLLPGTPDAPFPPACSMGCCSVFWRWPSPWPGWPSTIFSATTRAAGASTGCGCSPSSGELWRRCLAAPALALLLGAALTAAVILLCALCYYHLTPAGHLPPEPWGGLPLGWIGGNHA